MPIWGFLTELCYNTISYSNQLLVHNFLSLESLLLFKINSGWWAWVHKEINLSSPSGIIHSHLIGINKPKCVFRTTHSAINEFLQNSKISYFSKFSTASLPAWCVHDQSSVAENWLQLHHCSFGGNG